MAQPNWECCGQAGNCRGQEFKRCSPTAKDLCGSEPAVDWSAGRTTRFKFPLLQIRSQDPRSCLFLRIAKGTYGSERKPTAYRYCGTRDFTISARAKDCLPI